MGGNHWKGTTPRWAALRAVVLTEEDHCAICGRAVDFDLPPRSAWAPSVDHIVPLSKGGAKYDRTNCRLVHVRCNTAKKDRPVARKPPPRRPRPVEPVEAAPPLVDADGNPTIHSPDWPHWGGKGTKGGPFKVSRDW